jgi:hypothetical protein
MVLTVSFVLSPEIGLYCLRRERDCRSNHRRLGIGVEMPGPHDFSVRIEARRLRASLRPSHPAPNTRDDREAPLLIGHGTGRAYRDDLPDKPSGIFLSGALDSRLSVD